MSQAPAAPARPAGSQLPPLPVTQIDQRDAAASLDAQRGLSLSFLEPMPIGEVLRLLVEGTPFSLAVDPDATGTFRGELKRLTLREALDDAAGAARSRLRRAGHDHPGDAPPHRDAAVRPEPAERAARHAAHRDQRRRQRRRSPPRSPPTTCFAGIADGVAVAAVGPRPRARRSRARASRWSATSRSGWIASASTSRRCSRAARARCGSRRGSSKSRCATRRRSTGALVREKLGLPRNDADAGIAADPLALRNALAAQGEIRDLWAPEVTTMNNEPAMVHVSTPGSSSLTLTVVPQISADGIVQLSISHAWDAHDGDQKQGFMKPSTPLMRGIGADTVTRVMDGNTVMISGLLRPTRDRGAARPAWPESSAARRRRRCVPSWWCCCGRRSSRRARWLSAVGSLLVS